MPAKTYLSIFFSILFSILYAYGLYYFATTGLWIPFYLLMGVQILVVFFTFVGSLKMVKNAFFSDESDQLVKELKDFVLFTFKSSNAFLLGTIASPALRIFMVVISFAFLIINAYVYVLIGFQTVASFILICGVLNTLMFNYKTKIVGQTYEEAARIKLQQIKNQ